MAMNTSFEMSAFILYHLVLRAEQLVTIESSSVFVLHTFSSYISEQNGLVSIDQGFDTYCIGINIVFITELICSSFISYHIISYQASLLETYKLI